MIFWLTISIITVIALAIVLIPYWRKANVNSMENSELNIILYKRRLGELENDLNNDVLDKEQYDSAVSELKLQLLSDVSENQEGDTDNKGSKHLHEPAQWAKQTIIATVLLVPVLSISMYLHLGNRTIATGNSKTAVQQAAPVSPEITKMVAGLEKRLQSQPKDKRGWFMLGRSYVVMNQHDKALAAYEKAYALAPEDPDVLTNLAETLAVLNNNQLQGRPLRLLNKSLEINKLHPRALWLAGHAQLQIGNTEKAVAYWQSLLSNLPPEHEATQKVRNMIAQVGGQPNTQSSKMTGAKKTERDISNEPGIKVRVTLDKKFRHAVKPDTAVFIFARAASGPKMPLAGVKLKARDLPANVVLNDSNAMIPGRTLSGVDQVIIGARISKSGGPVSKRGDLEGFSPVISSLHPEMLNVTIDQVVN